MGDAVSTLGHYTNPLGAIVKATGHPGAAHKLDLAAGSADLLALAILGGLAAGPALAGGSGAAGGVAGAGGAGGGGGSVESLLAGAAADATGGAPASGAAAPGVLSRLGGAIKADPLRAIQVAQGLVPREGEPPRPPAPPAPPVPVPMPVAGPDRLAAYVTRATSGGDPLAALLRYLASRGGA